MYTHRTNEEPKRGQLCICKCPEWCEYGLQIATWNGSKFEYTEQSNDDFDDYVQEWCPIDEDGELE